MSFLGNMRIGFRLGAGFLLVVAVFAGIAWFQIRTIDRLGELQAEVGRRAAEARSIGEADAHFENMAAIIGDAVVVGDLGASRRELAEYKTSAARLVEAVSAAANTDLSRKEAESFRQSYQQYIALVESRLLPLLERTENRLPMEVRLLEKEVGGIRNRGMASLDLLKVNLNHAAEESSRQFQAIHASSVRTAVLLSLGGTAAAVALAVLITLGITRPLRKGVDFALAVAEGDLDRPLDVRRDDEVGRTCRALQAVAATLKDVLGEFERTVRRIETGHLEDRGDAARFSGAFAGLIRGANRISDVLLSTINTLPLPVLTLSTDYEVLYLNQAGQKLVGRDSKALAGLKCHDLFKTGDCRTGNCACARAMKGGRTESSETVARGTGRELDIAYSGSPIADRDGRVVGAVEVITDLTEIRGAERAMGRLAVEAERISRQLSASSGELSAQVEQSSRGAEVQRERAAETATAMEQMNSSVVEVARNAAEAAGSADAARGKAEDGADIVRQVVEAIGEVQRATADLTENMAQLGRQAEGIGAVMTVITDIADQTNLLALNAAIEAARAGDAGRGFAVVADEVRKLAEKTMNATREVGQAIGNIQDMTRKNVQATDAAARAVARSTELAQGSGEALRGIVSMSGSAADQVRNIATASEEQSAAVEQISRSTEEINRISTETSRTMGESVRAIAELAKLAQDLQALISQMRV